MRLLCYPDQGEQLAELVAGTGPHATRQAELLDYLPPDADRYGGTAVATRWSHRVREVLDHRPAGAGDAHWWTVAVSVEVRRQAPDHRAPAGLTPTARR